MRRLMGAVVAGLLVATVTTFPGETWAQNAATSTTPTSAEVLEPSAIAVTRDLTFTIVVDTINTIKNSLAAQASFAEAGASDANVVVAGGGKAFSIAMPTSIDVVRSGGVESITVRTVGPVSSVFGADGRTVSGLLSGGLFGTPVAVTGDLSGGILTFSVGGRVTVSNDLVPGNYHGVLTVVAQYN